MNNVKRVNAFLWLGNVVLIIGIVAFALQFLILQEAMAPEVDPPISIPAGPGKTQAYTDTKSLAGLANPMKPIVMGTGPGPRESGPVRLTGTFAIQDDPTSHTAFLVVVNRSLSVNAYAGEAIRDESVGVEVPELASWRLKEVTPTTAVFATDKGEQTLKLEEITASAAATPGTPGFKPPTELTAWEKAKYTTKKDDARSDDSREMWSVDRKEVEWAGQNWESVLQGVGLEAYPGGGLKITALPEGGYASDRGFRAGDVVKVINNQAVDSITRLQDVMKSMARNTTVLSVIVDRGGRLYTLQYQVQPNVRR